MTDGDLLRVGFVRAEDGSFSPPGIGEIKQQRRMPAEPKVESWAQSGSGKQPTKDFVTILREENQRLRIERAGHLSHIDELKAEIAQLKAERETMRAAVAALPLPPPTDG